jgi:hypothetical protein
MWKTFQWRFIVVSTSTVFFFLCTPVTCFQLRGAVVGPPDRGNVGSTVEGSRARFNCGPILANTITFAVPAGEPLACSRCLMSNAIPMKPCLGLFSLISSSSTTPVRKGALWKVFQYYMMFCTWWHRRTLSTVRVIALVCLLSDRRETKWKLWWPNLVECLIIGAQW